MTGTQTNVQIAIRKPAATIRILDIQGEIAGPAEGALMAAHHEASEHGVRTLILNLTRLECIKGSGIGPLIRFLVHAQRQKQRLLAFGLGELHRQVFELTHLDQAFDLFTDEAEALRHVGH